MSGGPACLSRDHDDDHEVTMRNANASAFNGYELEWSRYSEVRCRVTGRIWRTKAGYVGSLPDAPPDWAKTHGTAADPRYDPASKRSVGGGRPPRRART